MAIHCPECAYGTLKVIKPKVVNGWTHFYNSEGVLIDTGAIKSDEVFVYCEECGHHHVMKERSFREPKYTPRKQKIKGYGTYHY